VIACPLEVFLLGRPWIPPLAYAMIAVVAATMAVRYWAIATLGERWNTRIVCLPGAPLIEHGPYRFVRHPNYLAVAFEVPALALVHTAWLTAIVFGGLNLLVLRRRIRTEDAALRRYAPAKAPARG
jgi:methyltransferase